MSEVAPLTELGEAMRCRGQRSDGSPMAVGVKRGYKSGGAPEKYTDRREGLFGGPLPFRGCREATLQ